jgi:Rod binding domain-containing protein
MNVSHVNHHGGIAQATAHDSANGVPIEKLADNKQLSEQSKVAEVSKQFEAILLREIIGKAQNGMIAGAAKSSATTRSIYQDMVTNQLAESVSRSGAVGLGRELERQLSRSPDLRSASRNTEPQSAVSQSSSLRAASKGDKPGSSNAQPADSRRYRSPEARATPAAATHKYLSHVPSRGGATLLMQHPADTGPRRK